MRSRTSLSEESTPSTRIQLVQQQHQLLVQKKEQLVQEKQQLLQRQQQRQQQLVASISATATAINTSKMSSSSLSSSYESQTRELLVQQQQQMRAKSLEKELERKRQRQYEKDNPTPESTAEKKNNRVSAALDNPAFIQSVLNQPENVDKCLDEAETSVYELLYRDPIDYTGEHIFDAFRFKSILKSNSEYIKLYGVDVDELKKQRTQAFLDYNNGNTDDEAVSAVIESGYAYIDATESNNKEWTIFKNKEKCSITIITQQAQIIEQEPQEDNNSSTIIINDDNNVFNELITYYNGGGGC